MSFLDDLLKLSVLKQREDAERGFEPDPERFDAYVKFVEFFSKLATEQGGVIDQSSVMPHGTSGYITVRFSKLVLKGETLQSFISIFRASGTFEVSPNLDGSFDIGLVFPHVFKLKS